MPDRFLITDRFKDAPWLPKEDIYVSIGGAGGIGSWTALLLSRAGFIPVVYDFDSVEQHNLGGQLYGHRHIGKFKVDALSEIITSLSGQIVVYNSRMNENTPSNHLTISAFDNMKARKDVFERWVKVYGNDSKAIFIDGRLQAEHMQIFCIRGGDTININKYTLEYLFNDSEVEEAVCTFKQTSHAAAMIASHIVGLFTNHMSNALNSNNDRTVSFKWEYFIPMSYIEEIP